MHISEIELTITPESKQASRYADGGHRGRLVAYCSFIIDDSIKVHGAKIIDDNGRLFLAMPTMKIKTKCVRCHSGNEIMSRFCNWCGAALSPPISTDESVTLYRDIVHPINSSARRNLEDAIFIHYDETLRMTATPYAVGIVN